MHLVATTAPYARHGPWLAPGGSRGFIAGMNPERGAREQALIACVRSVAEQRSVGAFRTLFEHYMPRVRAYLRKLGAADEVAEDLAQEVLLSVWRRAHQFDPAKATLSTWIFTIARNKRIDGLRRERRPELDLDDPTLEPEPAARGDRAAELRQISKQLMEAVATLPKEQSLLLQVFYFEDKTHSAIAEQLGLPLGTVKSRLRLALGKLRGILGDRDP